MRKGKAADQEARVQEELAKVSKLLRHMRHVQENAYLLGSRLIQRGQFELGRMLIANSMLHDHSKFFGIEWDHLHADDSLLRKAISQHNRTNPHHPEYWGGIQNMPSIYLAELVCDWKSRSNEFGKDLREWIEKKATKRWDFSMDSEVRRKIRSFTSLLLEPAFS